MQHVDFQGATLLLVDDREDLRAVTSELLASMGFRVVEASSAEEAEEAFRDGEETVEAMITDLDMPGADGLALTSRLRRRAPGLPVLLVSSRVGQPEVAAAAAAASVRVLEKPFTRSRLAAAVGALLRTAGASGDDSASVTPPTQSGGQLRAGVPTSRHGRGARALIVGWCIALAVVAALAVLLSRPGPPPLPPRSDAGVARGGSLALEAPIDLVDAQPAVFRWSPVTGAVGYQVTVQGVDDRVVWEAASSRAEVTTPPGVGAELEPGVAYFWWVEAVDGDGRVVAVSPRVRFQVRLTGASPRNGVAP